MIYEIKRLDLNPKKAKTDKFRWENFNQAEIRYIEISFNQSKEFPVTVDIALKRKPRTIPLPK